MARTDYTANTASEHAPKTKKLDLLRNTRGMQMQFSSISFRCIPCQNKKKQVRFAMTVLHEIPSIVCPAHCLPTQPWDLPPLFAFEERLPLQIFDAIAHELLQALGVREPRHVKALWTSSPAYSAFAFARHILRRSLRPDHTRLIEAAEL